MNEMENIEKQVRQIYQKVTNIEQILKGNEYDRDDKGMIGMQNDHEKRLLRLEKIWDRVFYVSLALGGFAGWGIMDIIQKIILKK